MPRVHQIICAVVVGMLPAGWCCAEIWPQGYTWPASRADGNYRSLADALPGAWGQAAHAEFAGGNVAGKGESAAVPPKRLPGFRTGVQPAAFLQPATPLDGVDLDDGFNDSARYSGNFSNESGARGVGVDLYAPPEFEGGLIIYGRDVAMKIGGFVKADFIYDFDPIDNTDAFDTTTIPVGAPRRTNARYHARQTRLSFDSRWLSDVDTIRVYVEGDFFSDRDRFRLRHAYGEVGSILVGQTWTTFTDVAASPSTLDFEGSVSSVNRRQALARLTRSFLHEDVTIAVAVEDTRFIIDAPPAIMGEPRSPSPDFVARVRLNRPSGQFQIACLYRIGGFQATGGDVITASAWGLNFAGVLLVSPATKAYYQILFGDGIGSYRNLPDAAPSSPTTAELLGMFGWMVGVTHDWTEELSSNFTYAENRLDNAAMQPLDDVHRTTYLAANLIWNRYERVQVGIEYLYGLRENIDRAEGSANRVQVAFIFNLP